MTKEELAKKLNGNEYGKEISKKLEAEAKKAGLIVIFGASDDLVEFRGAIHNEIRAWQGRIFFLDKHGLLPDRDQIEDDKTLEFFFQRRKTAKSVTAEWDSDEGYSWTFETDIPHAKFDIMEDGEKYCRGIIIDIKDLS